MIKSTLTKIRTHLVITVAAAVCMVVAVVALGFTVYEALRLVVIPVAASALTALIFFVLAAGSLAILTITPRKPAAQEPPPHTGFFSSIDWGRFAPLAAQAALAVTGILSERAERARGRRNDRGRR